MDSRGETVVPVSVPRQLDNEEPEGASGVPEGPTEPRGRSHSSTRHRKVELASEPNVKVGPAAIALSTAFGLSSGTAFGGDPSDAPDEVYEVSLVPRPRVYPVLLAGLSGVAVAQLLTWLFQLWSLWLSPLPVLAMLLAYRYEVRRVLRETRQVAGEVQVALEDIVTQEVEARAEILAFHERQKQWASLLESQVEERTAKLSEVLARIERLREASTHRLLGFSHDLRNPLTILRVSADALDSYRHVLPDDGEVVDDVRYAVERMESMLTDMASALSRDTGPTRRATQRISVVALHESLRRRMSALLFGREVRLTTVLGSHPEAIEADPLVVDRIMDNLLTNAAKYTEQGSIRLEFTGEPGYLLIRVTDTGRGIPADMIERIFRPRGSDPDARARHSLGVGLSVVLRLLAQAGGKLEVSSEVGRGSTFTVHLPQAMHLTPSIQARARDAASTDDLFDMVVKIRQRQGPSESGTGE